MPYFLALPGWESLKAPGGLLVLGSRRSKTSSAREGSLELAEHLPWVTRVTERGLFG
jgi:hypothetical protein